MTGQGTSQHECPRCGTQLPEFVTHCHSCGLRLDPGVAYFERPAAARERLSEAEAQATVPRDEPAPGSPQAPADGPSAEPAPSISYEHRTVNCLPMDLERIARAEAVDGWALLDTTVDPDRPGSIFAHFRRTSTAAQEPSGGDRAGAAAVGGPPKASGAEGAAGAADDVRTSAGTDRRAGQSVPGSQEEPATGSSAAGNPRPAPAPTQAVAPKKKEEWQYLLYVGLLVLSVLVLLRLMGPVGLLVALFFLPGLIRRALGMPSRKGRRKRRRDRRRRG